jgi:hypothetical protein
MRYIDFYAGKEQSAQRSQPPSAQQDEWDTGHIPQPGQPIEPEPLDQTSRSPRDHQAPQTTQVQVDTPPRQTRGHSVFSATRKVSATPTEEKVLWAIWAALLVGVAYAFSVNMLVR